MTFSISLLSLLLLLLLRSALGVIDGYSGASGVVGTVRVMATHDFQTPSNTRFELLLEVDDADSSLLLRDRRRQKPTTQRARFLHLEPRLAHRHQLSSGDRVLVHGAELDAGAMRIAALPFRHTYAHPFFNVSTLQVCVCVRVASNVSRPTIVS